jgi:hypothetical protein
MRRALLAAALALPACNLLPDALRTGIDIEVREVGRSLACNAAGEDAAVHLFRDLEAVAAWQAARGVTVAPPESLPRGAYALIEMGLRPTGGYGLAVSRAAVLRGERLTLNATFVAPRPGSIVTQAQSSPCALVWLPPGRYREVELLDQTGAVRAQGAPPGTGPS